MGKGIFARQKFIKRMYGKADKYIFCQRLTEKTKFAEFNLPSPPPPLAFFLFLLYSDIASLSNCWLELGRPLLLERKILLDKKTI